MTIRTKLSLGLGFLFIIIFVIAFLCSYYVDKLSQEASNILKDNYQSIVYSNNMLSALDKTRTSVSSAIFNPGDNKKLSDYYSQLFQAGKIEFDKNLKDENNNITEIHEQDYVNRLNQDYAVYLSLCDKIKSGSGSSSMYFTEFLPCYEKVQQSVRSINDLNMEAVVRKSEQTKQQSEKIKTQMALITALCIVLALGYFWYFPIYISNSISFLSKKMIELLREDGITNNLRTNDETFIILRAIDLLEKKHGLKKSGNDHPK